MEALQRNPEESLRRIVFKLRFYREAAGVSQKKASEKLCVGHRSYQRIESGETNVDITFLLRFSQLFNVNFMELVTPYPPLANELEIFSSPEEIKVFENLPFVKKSDFLNWSQKFLSKSSDFGNDLEFTQNPIPMCLWSASKKIMNETMLSRLLLSRDLRKMSFYFLKPQVRLNYLDNLYYHKPKYSLKKMKDHLKNGDSCEVELYSIHTFPSDEVMSFSIVNFL